MSPFRTLLRSSLGAPVILAAVLLLGAHAQLDVRLATSGPIEVGTPAWPMGEGDTGELAGSTPAFVAFSAFAVGPGTVELPAQVRAHTPAGFDAADRSLQARAEARDRAAVEAGRIERITQGRTAVSTSRLHLYGTYRL